MRHIDFSKSVLEEHSASSEYTACDISAQCDAGSNESGLQLLPEDESHCKGNQTDLLIREIQQLVDDKSRLIEASENEKFDIGGLYSFKYYEKNMDKVGCYTDMPKFEVLKLVYNFIEGHMNSNINGLSGENEFLLCMLKLRMNYLFKDMSHQLNVTVATVQRRFHSTLDVLYTRLRFFCKVANTRKLKKINANVFPKGIWGEVMVIEHASTAVQQKQQQWMRPKGEKKKWQNNAREAISLGR
ncbi:hypothetical protein CHS0354_007094 [Potamilus streckersoni]|uniref:Transposase Helix-turn-helix domain-containing protein n=1 Tax=Potamilus streckersoni TaxID=2493646 RepID=A0AAE0TB94_9BIVA|nr:hypothetical protein CHS0354_007094 [Potamilus streckersoni]